MNQIKVSNFENQISPIKDLTFVEADNLFSEKGFEFYGSFKVLGLLDPETKEYTNLALLLSDQNPYSFKTALFSDKYKTNIIERKEIFGSVFKQIREVYEHTLLVNNLAFPLGCNIRVEKADYPGRAYKEVITNAVVHRRYDYGESTFVKYNNRNLEVSSFGSLLKGIKEEDILRGVSCFRNPKLANIFLKLGLIKGRGEGIPSVFDEYLNEEIKPTFSITPNVFQIKLPNRNYPLINKSQSQL